MAIIPAGLKAGTCYIEVQMKLSCYRPSQQYIFNLPPFHNFFKNCLP